ncbi:MAG: type II toxin-antitoxin system ParD family antitoxin [Erythrobacter sp.]|nr:type II toxin-antitoxin system ParD family antitoxin [Erythrobacter sp.]
MVTNICYTIIMAVKTTSVALGDKLTEYTRRKVESGEFGSASEVIRDALRRAEERDRKIDRLRQLIREGEESGDPQPFDWDGFMTRKFPDA